jgi:Nuclease A inhibitor-like protein
MFATYQYARRQSRMPNITAPTVRGFTETWTADFEKALKKAAGSDGRLSLAEAQKLAAASTSDKMFGDNAVNDLTKTGKQSVSVKVLVSAGSEYAERAADAAAGPDGRISKANADKLPADLRRDFFELREKSAANTGPVRPPASALPAVKAKLEAAVDGLFLQSETDAQFKFLSGKQLKGAPITEGIIRRQLTRQHNALLPEVMYVGGPANLSGRTPVEQRSATDFLDRVIAKVDPSDPVSVANGQRFAKLKTALQSELTDLTVFRFGSTNISTFIVGRTKTGELAGLLTGQVET